MAKLLFKNGGGPAQELFLKSGVNRIGRNSENDIQIEHPSVSSFHCEITCAEDSIRVKDLGSTNGTFLDGRAISEASPKPGQRLQFGLVEMAVDAPAAEVAAPVMGGASVPASNAVPGRLSVRRHETAAEAPAEAAPQEPEPAFANEIPPALPQSHAQPAGGLCKYHPRTAARWTCGGCHQLYCGLCVTSRAGSSQTRKFCRACGGECSAVSVNIVIPELEAKGFFSQLPGVFIYPFRKNGIWMLVIGMVVFALLSFAARFSLWALIFGTGYFLSYMQRIMTSSGQGEHEMPGWPDFSDFFGDIIMPMLLLAGTAFACAAPGLACLFFGSDEIKMAAIPLFALGAFYFPMAVLAVGMTDNIFSLNPLVIIPSILKLFVPYLVAALFLGVLFGVYKLSQILADLIDVPVLSGLVISFLSLYFGALLMRVLGLLYFTNKDRLGWFNRA